MDKTIGIQDIAFYLPDFKDVTYLPESGMMSEKEFHRNGVVKVPEARGMPASELALRAAERLLEKTFVSPKEIDVLVYTGGSIPDYLIWVASAKICHAIGAENAFGYDINLGCGGMSMALKTVTDNLASNANWNTALIVTGDNWGDATSHRVANSVIWGDAGGAMLVRKGMNQNTIQHFDAITRGYYHDLAFYTGGTPLADQFYRDNPDKPYKVYSTGNTSKLYEMIGENVDNYRCIAERVTKGANINMDDISYLIVPAGRYRLMKKIIDVIGIEEDKTNLPFVAGKGDCGASSIVIDLAELMSKYKPKNGEYTLCLGAGVGITYTGLLIKH